MSSDRNVFPKLKLAERETPLKKISLTNVPKEIYEELERRSDQLGKRIQVYCRIVLEHAMEYKNDYAGPNFRLLQDPRHYGEQIHIPIASSEFLDDLVRWDPFGDGKKNKIAINILRKHLEVRSW